MSKVIPFSDLSRLQHLNFLERKRREYQEQEDYLRRLRKMLFQLEGRMRQAEIQQLELFQQTARHFGLNTKLSGLMDRLQMHQAFADSPLLTILQDFFTGRLTPEECYQHLLLLNNKSEP